MIIRQTLNFAAHLAAGVAFGALAVVAAGACAKAVRSKSRTRDDVEPLETSEPLTT